MRLYKKSVIIISNKCSDFLSTSGEPSVKRIDLQALTLAGPLRHKSVPDPLAVQLLKTDYICLKNKNAI